MQFSVHGEIIAVLTELYTLLDTLAAIEPGLVRLPPADTGIHPSSVFNADAAKAAGFNAEAVEVLSALPYLDIGRHEMFLELEPSTYPLSYLGLDLDGGYFSSYREILEDYETGTENLMPPSAIQLTWEEGGHGVIYIYDTKTKLMTPWRHWGDPTDNLDYFHVPAVSPRQALQPMIDNFRGLRYLGKPPFIEISNNLESEWGRSPPKDWAGWHNKDEFATYQAEYDAWEAMRKLADIYVECGWDVNAMIQQGFRRAEFITKRERHLEDVVKPLEEKADRMRSGINLKGVHDRSEL